MPRNTGKSNLRFYGIYTHGYFGKRHIPTGSLKRGLPDYLKGEAIEVVQKLICEGILVAKKTAHGTDVSIILDGQ